MVVTVGAKTISILRTVEFRRQMAIQGTIVNRIFKLSLLSVVMSLPLIAPVSVSANATTKSPAAFSSESAIVQSIASFEKQLKTSGKVDLSSTPNLIHEITNVSSDWEKLKPDSGTLCVGWVGETNVAANPCVWGSASSKVTMVLFGDSHLDQWLSDFVQIAGTRKWRVVSFLRDGCGAAQSQTTALYGSTVLAQSQCLKWRANSLASIKKLDPNFIVYTSSTGGLNVGVGTSPGPGIKSYLSQEQSLVKTLILDVSGHVKKHVISIADTMRATYKNGSGFYTTATCLSQSGLQVSYDASYTPTVASNNRNACYRIFNDENTDAGTTVRQNLIQTDRNLGISVINPEPWMCDTSQPTGVCPPVIANTLVYYDTGHITLSFSKLLVNLISNELPTK